MYFVRPNLEQVQFCMEPFVRREMSLEAYRAFVFADHEFFDRACEERRDEFVVTGVVKKPVRFPTLLELEDVKRYLLIVLR